MGRCFRKPDALRLVGIGHVIYPSVRVKVKLLCQKLNLHVTRLAIEAGHLVVVSNLYQSGPKIMHGS